MRHLFSKSFLRQFVDFGVKQALSCIFPVSIFLILAITQYVHIPHVHRYDLILIVCLAVQAVMYVTKIETLDELKVIGVFHIFGLALELFKTHAGSWAYPEPAITKIGGVPLYSGFMYASVASYMCQAWRRLDLRLKRWPTAAIVGPFAAVVYLNFFSEHFVPDLRILLIPAVFVLFRRTTVEYVVAGIRRRMPLAVSFLLIGFFVWLAENIATFLHGWQYPNQVHSWSIVHGSKITSWFLLVIISFICVAQLKHVKARLRREPDPVSELDPSDLPALEPQSIGTTGSTGLVTVPVPGAQE